MSWKCGKVLSHQWSQRAASAEASVSWIWASVPGRHSTEQQAVCLAIWQLQGPLGQVEAGKRWNWAGGGRLKGRIGPGRGMRAAAKTAAES